MMENIQTKDAHSLVFNHTYNAPASLVFDAWTDPKHLARWWGPNGFTTTTREMTVTVGGVWSYTMIAPDGTSLHCKAIYTVVDRPRRLCFSNTGGDPVHQHLTGDYTADFNEADGRTHLTLQVNFRTQQALEIARDLGAKRGGDESLERLAEVLQIDRIRSATIRRKTQ